MKSLKELLNFGIVLIDKPSGPTSFSVSDFIRNKLSKYGIKKTSHFGTLDPQVTGMLPIALGRACKLTGFFLGEDKEYVGILHTHKEQEIKKLQELINKNFVGKIKQMPPHKSAVKRAERIREVKKWEILESSEDKKYFLFIAEVEGGTYIRKLCSDLGDLIGGANMLELRRTRAGIFSEKDKEFINLYDFENFLEDEKDLEKIIIPAEKAIKKIMPFVEVADKNLLKSLLNGKPLFRQDLKSLPTANEKGNFAVFCGETFVGIYKKTDENNIVGRAEFIFS